MLNSGGSIRRTAERLNITVMSLGPGRIVAEETVELSRPRDPTSPEFNALGRRLSGVLGSHHCVWHVWKYFEWQRMGVMCRMDSGDEPGYDDGGRSTVGLRDGVSA